MSMFLSRTVRSLSSFARQALSRAAAPATGRAAMVESLEDRKLLSLTIDVQLQDGSKAVNASVGSTVKMNVYAVVSGANSVGTDEGFQSFIGSFLSTGGTRGNLTFHLADRFKTTPSQDSSTTSAAANVDLDGDGDLDLGSNSASSVNGFVVGRASSMQSEGSVSGARKSFLLGELQFKVTGGSGGVGINYRPMNNLVTGLWVEDGVVKNRTNSTIQGGKPVVINGSAGGGGTTVASLSRGTLTVNGSAANNAMSLMTVKGQIRVTVDGKSQSFSTSQIKKIVVDGKGGNDTINLAKLNRNATVVGGDGNDTITGSLTNDRVEGGSGNDLLNGSSGNDIILGGSGVDQLFGGDGNDRLEGGSSADVFSGGTGTDTADYARESKALTVTLDGVANDGRAGEADNVKTDVENVWGGSGNDRITGSSASNLLSGGSGADSLFGGGGNDTLDGGKGVDQLFGDSGNDRLLSKDGVRDLLNGGAGKDSALADLSPKKIADRRSSIERLG